MQTTNRSVVGNLTLENDKGTAGGLGFVLSDVTVDMLLDVINCYLIPSVAVFGLIGNIVSFAILVMRPMRQSSTNMVLAYLALIDMFNLLITLVRKSTCLIEKIDKANAYIIDIISLTYLIFIQIIFSRISNMCSLVICCERYIAVFKPLKVKFWVTRKRMAWCLFAVSVISVAALSINFRISTISWSCNERYNRSMPTVMYYSFYLNNKQFVNAYNRIGLALGLRLIPSFFMIILSIAIIAKLQRRRIWRKDATCENVVVKNSSGEEDLKELRSVTKMLMTIVLIFIVCLFPGNLNIILALSNKEFAIDGAYRNEYRAFSSLTVFGEVVNASANFIVYVAMNKKLVRVLLGMFCRSRRENVSLPLSS